MGDGKLGFQLRALAFLARGFGAFGEALACFGLLALQPLALCFLEVGNAAAGLLVDAWLYVVGAQEGDQFAIGHGKEEFRIAAVIVRAETVDPDDAAALVEQGAAGISARDGRGVEDGIELPAGAFAGHEATALHRRLAAKEVGNVEALRAVHVHRVPHASHLARTGHRAAGQGEGRQAQISGQPDKRKVVAGTGSDDLAVDRIRPA